MCQRKSHQVQGDRISDHCDAGVRHTLSDKRTCGILIQAPGLLGSSPWGLLVQEYSGTNRMFRKERGGTSRFNGMRTLSRPGEGPWKSKRCGKKHFPHRFFGDSPRGKLFPPQTLGVSGPWGTQALYVC